MRVPDRYIDEYFDQGFTIHEYWNDQTIADMAIRYPGIDMSPYATAHPPAITG